MKKIITNILKSILWLGFAAFIIFLLFCFLTLIYIIITKIGLKIVLLAFLIAICVSLGFVYGLICIFNKIF